MHDTSWNRSDNIVPSACDRGHTPPPPPSPSPSPPSPLPSRDAITDARKYAARDAV